MNQGQLPVAVTFQLSFPDAQEAQRLKIHWSKPDLSPDRPGGGHVTRTDTSIPTLTHIFSLLSSD